MKETNFQLYFVSMYVCTHLYSFCLYFAAEFLLSTSHLQRQQRDVSQKPDDNILLTESIQITDKFGFNKEDANALNSAEQREKIYAGISEESFTCLNGYGEYKRWKFD